MTRSDVWPATPWPRTDEEWFGITGMHRGFEDTMTMLVVAQRHGGYELGSADLTTAAVGPDETCDVVRMGLLPTTAPDGTPVVISVRSAPPMPMRAEISVQLEVLAAARDAATATRDRIDELVRANDVLRGQVLAFGATTISAMSGPNLSRKHHAPTVGSRRCGNTLSTATPRTPPSGTCRASRNSATGPGAPADVPGVACGLDSRLLIGAI